MERLFGEEGLVRSEHHIGYHEQTSEHVVVDHLVASVFVEVVFLFFVHVETGRTDALGAQALDEVLGVDELTAAGVDNHHAGLHLGDAFGVDDVLRLGCKRAVERDDVALRVEFVEFYDLHVILLGKFVIGIEVVGQNVHAEAAQDLDQFLGDATHTDQAGCFAVHVEAEKPLELEVSVAGAVDGTIDLAVERKHERHGILSHGVGRVGGHAHHVDAAFGGFEVDVVETGTAQCDEFHPVAHEFVDDGGVALGVHKDTNHVGPLGEGHGFHREVLFVVVDVEAEISVRLIERLLIVRVSVEHGNFNHILVEILMVNDIERRFSRLSGEKVVPSGCEISGFAMRYKVLRAFLHDMGAPTALFCKRAAQSLPIAGIRR